MTVTRDSLSDIYIFMVTDAETTLQQVPGTGQSVGYDFGLKNFLTASDEADVQSPLFFPRSASQVKRANQNLSSKQGGSNNRHQARLNLARKHREIANQGHDFSGNWPTQSAMTMTTSSSRI